MALPFLARYSATVGDGGRGRDEAARQLLVYARHLGDPGTGLLRHAYDERRRAPWADPRTGRSPETWCRGVGWYAMALVEVLEALPRGHARRPGLLSLLGELVAALERYQDPGTGRWFQVVDEGRLRGNWVETSCSSMFTYAVSRAVERGYVPGRYAGVADRGYRGVLGAVSTGPDGQAHLGEIGIGTVVGDLAYYLARPRVRDDPHGVGAFLVMHEQVRRTAGAGGRADLEVR
jgi:unsaturated rhamnogalacturonyl hydrolase